MSEAIKVIQCRGTVRLVGSVIQSMGEKYINEVPTSAVRNKDMRDGMPNGAREFHVTVISPAEMELVNTLNLPMQAVDVGDVGVARVRSGRIEAWYVVVYSAKLQNFRKSLSLPEKDFHITLGFFESDPHGNPSGASLSKAIEIYNHPSQLIATAKKICMLPLLEWCEKEKTIVESSAIYLLENLAPVNAIE